MLDHVTLQVADVAASKAFYQALLGPLGVTLVVDDGTVAGFFGREPGAFWLCPAQRVADRELHVAFRAGSRDEVRAFHAVAHDLGTGILHEPRLFPEYHEHYFAAFVRDLDGHNIEAVCRTPG